MQTYLEYELLLKVRTPYLLFELVEDELHHNVILHLQQLGSPLSDPRLQDVQLYLTRQS